MKYPDAWHIQHMEDPRSIVPESVMPSYPWLAKTSLDGSYIQKKLSVMRTLGVPYTDQDIANGPVEVKGKTELDALIAYLQGLGNAVKRP